MRRWRRVPQRAVCVFRARRGAIANRKSQVTRRNHGAMSAAEQQRVEQQYAQACARAEVAGIRVKTYQNLLAAARIRGDEVMGRIAWDDLGNAQHVLHNATAAKAACARLRRMRRDNAFTGDMMRVARDIARVKAVRAGRVDARREAAMNRVDDHTDTQEAVADFSHDLAHNLDPNVDGTFDDMWTAAAATTGAFDAVHGVSDALIDEQPLQLPSPPSTPVHHAGSNPPPTPPALPAWRRSMAAAGVALS